MQAKEEHNEYEEPAGFEPDSIEKRPLAIRIPLLLLKGILLFVVMLLVLLTGTWAALQFSSVQTYLTGRISKTLSDKTGYAVTVDRVNIDWFDKAVFEGVEIADTAGRPMVYIESLEADYKYLSLIQDHHIEIDELVLHKPHFHLTTYPVSNKLNITGFIDRLLELSKDTTPRDSTFRYTLISIDEAYIDDGTVSYNDIQADSLTDRFDYYHFVFEDFDLAATDFRSIADTIDMNINQLQGREPISGLAINEFKSFFRTTEQSLLLAQLQTRINESYISDTVLFTYDHSRQFSYFNDSIKMHLHFDSTRLRWQDMALFAPELEPYNETMLLSGTIDGFVRDLYSNNISLQFGNSSYAYGKFRMNGLPDFYDTYISLTLKESNINTADLKQYIPPSEYKTARLFGDVEFKGNFSGFPLDFVAYGDFNTALGRVKSDLQLVIKDSEKDTRYSGSINTQNFNLGKLTGQPKLLQTININGDIKGNGLTLETASARIDARISKIGVKGYNYRNIKTNALISKELLGGFLSIADSNLIATVNGQLDLRNRTERFDGFAHIERANLDKLGLSNTLTAISTDFNLNIKNFNLEKLEGSGRLQNTTFTLNETTFEPGNVLFSSARYKDSLRFVKLQSDYADIEARGEFNFEDVAADMSQVLQEYQFIFTQDSTRRQIYYKNKKNVSPYRVDYEIRVQDINKLVQSYDSTFYLSPGILVEGRLQNNGPVLMMLNTRLDTVRWQNNELYDTELDVTASKMPENENVLAAIYLFSESQKLRGVVPTEDLLFDGVWNDDLIDFKAAIGQQNENNHARLDGGLQFLPGRYEISLTEADVDILGQTWQLSDSNLTTVFSSDSIVIKDLVFANQEQLLALQGIISNNKSDSLSLIIDNFSLVTLKPILDLDIEGTLKATAHLTGITDTLRIYTHAHIDSLRSAGFLIGNIDGQIRWNKFQQRFDVLADITRNGEATAWVEGAISPGGQLDLEATSKGIRLKLLEPFMTGVMSDIQGAAYGTLKIKGPIDDPAVNGALDIKRGRFKVDYTQVTYHFDDKIYFEKEAILFNGLRLYDDFENMALFRNGGIRHKNFSQINFDVRADLKNLLMLNTTLDDNTLFYGTGYGSGPFSITGPPNSILFGGEIVTEKGTSLHVPVDFAETVGEKSFISYTSRRIDADGNETNNKLQEPEGIDISGIGLDLNLIITPDAYVEIIFDKRAGDILRGYGRGRLKFTLDTRSDFAMLGRYDIIKGSYTFTLKNLFIKEFKLKPGGNIVWNGDPLQGRMDVKAGYRQNVSLIPISSDTTSTFLSRPEVRRRYPVEIDMEMSGPLLSPLIAFGIEIEDYPNVFSADVTRFESLLVGNEQELNRQVFSVLVFSQLSPQGAFVGNLASGISSVSEMISSQLGNWFSQVDENLEVNINLNGFDQEALNILQLRLSYTLLDGRLRITRDGQFTNAYNQATANSIAGDIMVEYLLTKDGQLRVKVFRKNNQNLVTSATQLNTTTTSGFSVLYTTTFNNLQELINRKKANQNKTEEGEAQPDMPELSEPLIEEEPILPRKATDQPANPEPDKGADKPIKEPSLK